MDYYVGATFDVPEIHDSGCAKPARRPAFAHTALGVKQGLRGIIRCACRACGGSQALCGARYLPTEGCGIRDGALGSLETPEMEDVVPLPRPVAAPLVQRADCIPLAYKVQCQL